LGIGVPTSLVHSPNLWCRPAMMRTSIQRLSLICEEFSFRIFAAAERARANSTSFKAVWSA
jgi:hypothetical protein